MIGTAVQWADDTVNPTMGCDGCELYNPRQPEEAACNASPVTTQRAGHAGYQPRFDRVMLFSGRMEHAARLPDLRGRSRLLYPWRNGFRVGEFPNVAKVADPSGIRVTATDACSVEDETRVRRGR